MSSAKKAISNGTTTEEDIDWPGSMEASLGEILSLTSPHCGAGRTGAKVERDPNGLDPKAGGAKLDAGKPCLWRGTIDYFPRALDAVAAISTFGAAKYSWAGWRTVPEGFERYSDAMVRHLTAESAQGPRDHDSGLHHAAHTAWNSLARLELILIAEENERLANK